MNSLLLKLLKSGGLLSDEHIEILSEQMQAHSISALSALMSSQLVSTQTLANYLSNHLNIKQVHLQDYAFSSICQQLDIADLIVDHLALPIDIQGQWLTLAVGDPIQPQLREDFQFATGLNIDLVIGDAARLQSIISTLYQHPRQLRQPEPHLEQFVIDEDDHNALSLQEHDQAPISQFIQQILHEAYQQNASDIHFEPYESTYRIRMRINGLLVTTQTPSHGVNRRLASRIKVLANLNIAERRLPQDGRIKLRLDTAIEMDLRVSTLPTQWGEKIVIRLLNTHHQALSLDQLGFSLRQQRLFTHHIEKPQGMILITGPTGSGKTVTLYSALNHLNTDSKNISTVEDPIEISLPGINQIQTSDKIGLSFSHILRALLRQDPDIIMIGEIRDKETATIALRAAQTGHLVLSTLHTNSAKETFTRLLQMGFPPYQLLSTIRLIVAQRLVRKLCPHCRVPMSSDEIFSGTISSGTISSDTCRDQEWQPDTTIYQANTQGCHACLTGYQGRIGIYEMLAPEPPDREQLDSQHALITTVDLSQVTLSSHHLLWHDGLQKVRQGLTALEELYRILESPDATGECE